MEDEYLLIAFNAGLQYLGRYWDYAASFGNIDSGIFTWDVACKSGWQEGRAYAAHCKYRNHDIDG